MKHRMYKIKKWEKDMDGNYSKGSGYGGCETAKGYTQMKRKRGRPPKR